MVEIFGRFVRITFRTGRRVFFFFLIFILTVWRMVVWLVSVMVVGGSGRDEVVVELWRKRKQHIEQTRKDKCAQRKWHSIKHVR